MPKKQGAERLPAGGGQRRDVEATTVPCDPQRRKGIQRFVCEKGHWRLDVDTGHAEQAVPNDIRDNLPFRKDEGIGRSLGNSSRGGARRRRDACVTVCRSMAASGGR